MLIHNIKEHLVEIKTINNLLRQSINLSAFERRNIQNKNNLKKDNTNRQPTQTDKATNNTNNVKYLETKTKKMQTKLFESNRKSVENIKEINRLKHQIKMSQISTVHRTL